MKLDKEMLRREFSKAWRRPDMVKYCVDHTAAVAILPDGAIITIDKQPIEKRFCFGESGYDYDDAAAAAAHARTSEAYFKSENMAGFYSKIGDLVDAMKGIGNYRLFILDKNYYDQSDDCRLRAGSFERMNDIIDACGGSCYIRELPGRRLTIKGRTGHIATDEEMQIILDAYKAAAADHEKKVDAYLKRYGLSKVRAWTYWRDA